MPPSILQPLYDVITSMVHTDYKDAAYAIKETIPRAMGKAMHLFDNLPVNPACKETMRDYDLQYMDLSLNEINAFNTEKDYRDTIALDDLIKRFQGDMLLTKQRLEQGEAQRNA
ncbi:MAG: hypothetical protein QM802_20895 [Agriterribacter sp.]